MAMLTSGRGRAGLRGCFISYPPAGTHVRDSARLERKGFPIVTCLLDGIPSSFNSLRHQERLLDSR